MATDPITYDKSDLRGIIRAFKAMDEQAVSEAKGVSNGLATYLQSKITAAAGSRPNRAAIRIAQGSRVSKSSKVGEISYGFVSQKFSGGGTTKQLWGGYEFGSQKFRQFPIWSGKAPGRGRLAILSIQHCVPNSLTSSLNGKMLSLRF
jgi:hypothetical protein